MTELRKIRKIKFTKYPTVENSEAISNPCCGLYTIFRFFAHDEIAPELGCAIEKVTLPPEQSLCLIEINLVHYNEGEISDEALYNVRRIFRHFSSNNKEMIVRFVYDWDGKGIQSEPKEISIILYHMQQLSPVLKQFTDSIYILQGLFIGSWGEMHNTRYLNERSLNKLAQQLYQCSGENTYIAVRSPSLWRTIFRTGDPLPESQAYTDSMQASFCLFNDSILASDTDYGTYGDVGKTASPGYADKRTRSEELEFQNKLCLYVPNGGETVNASEHNDFAEINKTLVLMHASYLNSQYDKEVLDRWKELGTDLKAAPWKDITAYDYIISHLGYRFVLEKVKLSDAKIHKNKARVKIQVRNTGFSCCYRQFNVSIIVRTPTFSQEYVQPVETDTRYWMPGCLVTLEEELDCSSWDQDAYILGLNIKDPLSGKSVHLSNSFSGFDYRGMHSLGHINISR